MIKFDAESFNKKLEKFKIRDEKTRSEKMRGLLQDIIKDVNDMFETHFNDRHTYIAVFECQKDARGKTSCDSIGSNHPTEGFFRRDDSAGRLRGMKRFILNNTGEKQAFQRTHTSNDELPGYYIMAVNAFTNSKRCLTFVTWRHVGYGPFCGYDILGILNLVKEGVEPILHFNEIIRQRRLRLGFKT